MSGFVVIDAVHPELRLAVPVVAKSGRPETPSETLHAAADAWLDIAGEPEVRQLVLLDAPSVLGWAGFREISLRYGLGLTEQLLTAAIDAGQLGRQPVRPLATVMIGALDEAAMSIANAEDPAHEQADIRAVVHALSLHQNEQINIGISGGMTIRV